MLKQKNFLPFKTNCLTERLNQTLSRALSKLVNEEHNDWDQKLDTILFAYRVSKQKSTGAVEEYLAEEDGDNYGYKFFLHRLQVD